MTKQNKARGTFILASAIFGTVGLFVRYIPLTSGEIALWRAVLASVLIGLFLLATKQKIPFRTIRKDVPLLLLSGATMGFNWIALFEAYKYTTVSMATLSYYFAPVIMTVASPLLFHETLTRKQILCFVMSTVGIVLITGAGFAGGGSDVKGVAFGLIAAVLYASVVLINKRIRSVSGVHRTLLQFLAAIVVLTPYVLLSERAGLASLPGMGLFMLLIVGVVHTGVTYCLYFSSLGFLTGQQAAILSYIDPLVAVILSVTLLGEAMTATQLIGGAMILGFTLLNELNIHK